ncbi:MAG TPA: hypothetical protein VFY84_10295 [Jiangellales bacterium]|nr:hypothetical protein [Jiangellales bacterium]
MSGSAAATSAEPAALGRAGLALSAQKRQHRPDPATVVAAYADRVLFLADGRVVDELAGPAPAGAIATRMARLEA